MILPNRVEYYQVGSGGMVRNHDIDYSLGIGSLYVAACDYAALAAENERLSLSVRHYVEQEALRNAGEVIHRQRIESGAYNREKNEIIKNLLAENERLRKAVERVLEDYEHGFICEAEVFNGIKAALHGGSTNPPDPA